MIVRKFEMFFFSWNLSHFPLERIKHELDGLAKKKIQIRLQSIYFIRL